MRKVTAALAAMATLTAVSCTDRMLETPQRRQQQNTSNKVEMRVQDIVFDDLTRVDVSSDEVSGMSFRWSERDTVGVYSTEGGFSRYTLSGGNGTASATFDGQGFALTPGGAYYAMYPYDGGKSDPAAVEISYEGRKVNGSNRIDDILPYDVLYACAQAGVNGGANFSFEHFSSFARFGFNFPAADSILSIDLLPSYDGITPGGSLDITTGTWTPAAGKTVTTIPAGIKTVSKGQNVKLWMPFAPQDFSGNDIAAVMRGSSGAIYTARIEGKNMQGGKAYRWENDVIRYGGDAGSPSSSLSLKKDNILSLGITGQFSGITPLGNNRYAVVHDNYKGGGIVFVNFDIGSYYSLSNVSYEIPKGTSDATNRRSPEGIVYFPDNQTLFVSAEGDQEILEYNLDGKPTGRRLEVPEDMKRANTQDNFGFETLAYNDNTGLFWTTTEHEIDRDRGYDGQKRMLLRLQSFGKDFKPAKRYFYLTDAPQKNQGDASIYAFGVPDILALDNGKLLVIEREAYIPEGSDVDKGLFTVVYIKIYEVDPVEDKSGILSKCSVLSKTYYSALSYTNYEGICLGPVVNGKQTILVISDSQDHYLGILEDKLGVITMN